MNNGFLMPHRPSDLDSVADIRHNQLDVRRDIGRKGTIATVYLRTEVIQYADLMAIGKKTSHGMNPDESSSTGNKHSQVNDPINVGSVATKAYTNSFQAIACHSRPPRLRDGHQSQLVLT